MPLTFPSHAAAILPLLHIRGVRRLPASALVLGTTAPDLIYLVGPLGAAAHHPAGLLSICLPAGLLAFLYVEALLLPVTAPLLVRCWPTPTLARLVGPRPLPRTARGWLAVALALVLGAATHQLWDGFTHAWQWPARVLYPDASVSLFGRPVLVARVLQHGSSVLGLALVLLYLRRTAAQAPPLAAPAGRRAHAARRLCTFVALPTIGAAIAAMMALRDPHPLLTRALWDAAWSATACFAVLLGLVCLVVRLRRRAHP